MGVMNIINIYDNYNAYFDSNKNFNGNSNMNIKAIFEILSKTAARSGVKIFLIGGIVRDMLLNRENHDIDITVQGDAIKFANLLEHEADAKILSTHKDFGTVKVQIRGIDIDLASTRAESYPEKGHLPLVDEIGCSLEKDVLRRDFTINSLAMSLNEADFANLVDYVNGFEDLKNRKIRILQDMSFVDDPTRIIRALKYSTRLGFNLDEETFKLQEEYLNNINYNMCYSRVKNELRKTFSQNLQVAFDRFIEQGIYKLVDEKKIQKVNYNIENLVNLYSPENPWLVYLGVILITHSEDILDKLELTKSEKGIILGAKSLLFEPFKNDFELYKAFAAQELETLLILAVLGREKEVYTFLNYLNKIKLEISGKELIELGYEPSKNFGACLDYVLSKKIEKPILSRRDEIRLAGEFFVTKKK